MIGGLYRDSEWCLYFDMRKQALGNALKAIVAHLMPLRYHTCAIGVV